MTIVHDIKIVWDELLDAFSSGQGDRVYFFDRQTGHIFFVPSALDDEEFWRRIETNQDRFLEIPRVDNSLERQIMSGFVGAIEDMELKCLLDGSLTGHKPYGKINDILSFFPEEQERLLEIKDDFLASRVKFWLEKNNLVTIESDSMFVPTI